MKTSRELDDAILEGHAARSFLQNPQFQQVIGELEDDIYNAWLNTQPQDVAVREQLWVKWHALEEILRGLRKPITESKIAAAEKRQNLYKANQETA